MTDRGHTPHHPSPSFPGEDDLLAWIEGERLPQERERAVAAALESDPRLARRLQAMRADRLAIRALPEVTCPPSVLQTVETALQPVLERQLLMGLSRGDPLDNEPPVSIVQPVRRSIVQTFFADRLGRRLAMAAGLLLVVGGVSFMAASYWYNSTQPSPITIATGPAKTEQDRQGEQLATRSQPETVQPTSPIPPTPATEESVAIALNTSDSPSEQAGKAHAGDAGAESPEPGMTIASVPDGAEKAPPEAAADDGISTDRAVELAREGRLVIRLVSADARMAANPARIADRIRRCDNRKARIGPDASPEVLARLAPHCTKAAQRMAASTPERQPVLYGGRDGVVSDLAPGLEGPPRPLDMIPAPKAVYMVQTRLDEESIRTLKRSIEDQTCKAVFEESAEPLPVEETLVLNPPAVMWWDQPPEGWTWWTTVPVVLDTLQ